MRAPHGRHRRRGNEPSKHARASRGVSRDYLGPYQGARVLREAGRGQEGERGMGLGEYFIRTAI